MEHNESAFGRTATKQPCDGCCERLSSRDSRASTQVSVTTTACKRVRENPARGTAYAKGHLSSKLGGELRSHDPARRSLVDLPPQRGDFS
jgi:hypothetical protein